MNVAEPPGITFTELGLIVPLPEPETAVETVYAAGGDVSVDSLNVALTVHVAVIGPVVYVVPLRDPPHPLTPAIVLPDAAEIVKLVVLPWLTVLEVGLIEPLPLPVTDVATV